MNNLPILATLIHLNPSPTPKPFKFQSSHHIVYKLILHFPFNNNPQFLQKQKTSNPQLFPPSKPHSKSIHLHL